MVGLERNNCPKPGLPGETLLDEGDTIVEDITPHADPQLKFSLPNHRIVRVAKYKSPAQVEIYRQSHRAITFQADEHEVSVLKDLSFEPPKLQWIEKNAITAN